MKNISEIDANFKIETSLNVKGIRFFDIQSAPFKVYGVFKEGGVYRRMPEKAAAGVSVGVLALHANNAGGRVRFKTDSPYVAVKAVYAGVGKMAHFAISGSAGLDLYFTDNDGKEVYKNTFIPPFDVKEGFEGIADFGCKKMRQITVNMPTYSTLKELYIGLDENSVTAPADDYKIKKPIVYYGSSITQGGCVSRPGNTYQARISRRLNADYINLGFSGNARGEDSMADYIKHLEMSAFVYDYDHNAPSAEYLLNTHERFLKRIREKNPALPVVMMSAPVFLPDDNWNTRREIIKGTYNNAVSAGDKNVYFIDGRELMAAAGNDGTVDNCHPNDLGFYSMAEKLGGVLEKVFAEQDLKR